MGLPTQEESTRIQTGTMATVIGRGGYSPSGGPVLVREGDGWVLAGMLYWAGEGRAVAERIDA